jgi:hypothetical protein
MQPEASKRQEAAAPSSNSAAPDAAVDTKFAKIIEVCPKLPKAI